MTIDDSFKKKLDHLINEAKTFLNEKQEYLRQIQVDKNELKSFSGSLDKTIKIWDLKSGKCIKTLMDNSVVRYIKEAHEKLICKLILVQ